jgi:hypothetical protein
LGPELTIKVDPSDVRPFASWLGQLVWDDGFGFLKRWIVGSLLTWPIDRLTVTGFAMRAVVQSYLGFIDACDKPGPRGKSQWHRRIQDSLPCGVTNLMDQERIIVGLMLPETKRWLLAHINTLSIFRQVARTSSWKGIMHRTSPHGQATCTGNSGADNKWRVEVDPCIRNSRSLVLSYETSCFQEPRSRGNGGAPTHVETCLFHVFSPNYW